MPKVSKHFGPKPGKAACFTFVPSKSVRKDYPDAELDELTMDLQDGEIMFVEKVDVPSVVGGSLVIETKFGKISLLEFDKMWTEISDYEEADDIVWDVFRMVEEWSFDD